MTQNKAAAKTKKAIKKVFGGIVSDAIIAKSVWAGDPYGWAQGALCTISLEEGLPGVEEPGMMDRWFQVSDEMGDLYVEQVNGGVAAVYKL